jgi:hypothetical protein
MTLSVGSVTPFVDTLAHHLRHGQPPPGFPALAQ